MNDEKFFSVAKELAPGCKDEAIPLWRDFAAECVDRGQFVRFESTTDKASAVEKWLGALSAGFRAVNERFGRDTASAVIDLRICIHKGERVW